MARSLCRDQRSLAPIEGLGIDAHPRFEQHLDDRDMAALRGDVQGGPSLAIVVIRIGAASEQPTNDVLMAAVGGDGQRRFEAIEGHPSDRRAAVDQQLEDCNVACSRRRVDRRHAVPLRARPKIEQERDDRGVAIRRRDAERIPRAAHFHVRTGRDQLAHDRQVARRRCHVDRHESAEGLDVGIRAALQQNFRDFDVAVTRGVMKRAEGVTVFGGDQLRLIFEQVVDPCGLTALGRAEQRPAATARQQDAEAKNDAHSITVRERAGATRSGVIRLASA